MITKIQNHDGAATNRYPIVDIEVTKGNVEKSTHSYLPKSFQNFKKWKNPRAIPVDFEYKTQSYQMESSQL